MATAIEQFGSALKHHAPEFGVQLSEERIDLLKRYYELLLKWNGRLHLVAPCSPEEFAIRHTLESLLLLKHLSAHSAVVDVGSGGGLPVIPCLLVRDDLQATLIESSRKKSVFLREALRLLKTPGRARVLTARFEELDAPPAEFLTCRALERFAEILPILTQWASPNTTFLLFGGESLARKLEVLLPFVKAEPVPGSERRFLLIGRSKI